MVEKGSVFIGLLMVCFLLLLLSVSAADIEISASTVSGNAPLAVSFSVISTEAPTNYSWDFNGDGTADSTEAAPSYTYVTEGSYEVALTTNLGTATKGIAVKNGMEASVVATPTSGVVPLKVQFMTVVMGGKAPLKYAWDFNGDGTSDSDQPNPSYTFTTQKDYEVKLTITDANNNLLVRTVPISVTKYDSHLNLSSCFPSELSVGENQITCLITNDGTAEVNSISTKIVGTGIQHLSSTTIATLSPGDQDSLTVKLNVLQAGTVTANLKVLEKSFPVTFNVVQQVQYNKAELQQQLDSLKNKSLEQEKIYYDKKAQGYPVSDIFDSNVRPLQGLIQNTQQLLLTNKLAEAKINMDMIGTAITDMTRSLNDVQKPKVTVTAWLKDNAVVITTVAAAFGILSTIFVKLMQHAKKAKDKAQQFSSELIHNKFGKKKETQTAHKEEHHEHHPPKEEKKL